MRLFRTITVLFCLLLMVLPLILAGIFEVQKIIVKYEMHESLEKEQLVTLQLSPSELHWYKKDKELLIGSLLFDVKSLTKTSSGYTITGLFDEKEKQIKEYLEELADEDEERKNKDKKPGAFHSWYYEDNSITLRVQYIIIRSSFPFYSEHSFNTSYPVIVQPPKFSLV
jgi:hypothetical protein